MNIRKKTISMKLDEKFLDLVTDQARRKFMTRSDYIRQAIAEKIDRDMIIRKNISGQKEDNSRLNQQNQENGDWQRFFLN